MEYHDTDSMAMKCKLNSLYGASIMNKREYICVMVDKEPTIIFKDKIVSISKRGGEYATIICVNTDSVYYTTNKYIDVVKMLI